MADLDVINRAHVRLRETHDEAGSVLESVLDQWREMADECAQIRRERDLAFSVLRAAVAVGSGSAPLWWELWEDQLTPEQRALVERLTGEQTDA